jgi:hypothetical protein
MYKSIKNEDDYYCLVQCDCRRKFKPEEMYICYACKKIKCQYCTRTEGQLFQCKAGCPSQFTTGTKNAKYCCKNCLECPLCFSPLTTKVFNEKLYLSCSTCYWNSLNIHITKGKKEEFEIYIQRMNEEICNGFLKKYYNTILNQLSNDKMVKKQIEIGDRINLESYNDIVKKAMEEGEQNLENFEKNNNLQIANEEKKETGKCEYKDDYLNNEENKYISFKKIIKLLHCYNDYTQNFNSLEEVQKAFNTNNLSLNAMTSLEQRHNNPILQNNCVLNQYPKFEDIIPKKQLFSKKCKECGKLIVEEVDDNQKDSRIVHSFIKQLPIVFINKIDSEHNFIKLRFILLNYNEINISFKEDPNSATKVILPEGKFNFDEIKPENQDIKNYKYKNVLLDFKFDESYKSELISNTSHILRFIVRAEFNRIESEKENVSVMAIEYPIEIKFKIK